MTAPEFHQLNLITGDMAASLAFYRRLGLPLAAEPGDQHVELCFPNGISIEWDSTESVPMWDSGWNRPADDGAGDRGNSGVVLGFALPSRDAVDETYAALTAAGHFGHQPPHDAFWGSRYAIIDDPDGNSVGLMSPIEVDRKYWPPVPPPARGA